MLARSVCFLFRNSFLFVLLLLPAILTTSLDFSPSDSVSDSSNTFSAPQTSSNTFKVLPSEEYYQNLDVDSDYSSSLISARPFNPLSADSYITILRQNNFYGTWRSCDKTSKPFENYFLNPTGLMILEVLNADITQGGNYFAKLPNLKKDVVNFHTSTTPARILASGITWSVLVKLYDGDFVDENSANIFYQFPDETAFTFTPANATLSITNGMIDIYLKDGDGDSTYYKRCMANFSIYFADESGQPYKDMLREASDIGIQFDLTSPDCNVNFSAGVLTTDDFEDSSQVRLLALISSIIALLELYGAYKIKSQIKNRKMVYKTAMGTMWMIATVDYYMLILNLVLIFAFSLLFIVPFFLYMFVTFYLERDIIIRILQETNKRQELDIADESCRSCGFYFGLSTVMFVFELVFILMSKLWVIQLTALIFIPQIIHNAKRDKPAYFNFYQVFLLGIVRIVFIAYLKYYPANIFRLSPDLDFVVLYSSIMIAQVVILLIQIRFPRLFFICSKRKRNRVLTEEDVCPICMGNFKSEAPTMADSLLLDFGELIETPCAHVFHVECLKKWVKSKVECPVCRSKISEVLEEVSSEEETVPSIERLL